jgi:tetratricopeptide (TPR) repeat protein
MGQYQRAIACYEQALRLAQEHKNRVEESVWLGNLGACYTDFGQSGRAIGYSEQALAIDREVGDRKGEATDLSNLGIHYDRLGQIPRSIAYSEQALAINRELARQDGEALNLSNLGNQYAELGQTAKALQCLNDALVIAREIGYRFIEAATLIIMGSVYRDQGEWGEAARQFKQAIEIADAIANTQYQQEARLQLALTNLYGGEFAAARTMAEAAQLYTFPLSNHSISAVLGVAALRQGDRPAAWVAFATALNQARDLLTHSPQFYAALDTTGLALCGLALCENAAHIPGAKAAYRAARALNVDTGVVGRVLRLFDTLAQADTVGLLAGVRVEATGEKPQ